MFSKFLGALLVSTLVLSATVASAAERKGPYLGAYVGVTIPEYDSGLALGATGGYDFGKFRLEGEFGYKDHGVNIYNLMVNGYYDFHNSTIFTPYIGAGIGVGLNEVKNVFSWQVGPGVDIAINKSFSVDIAYKFNGTTEVVPGYNDNSHNILAGIRYKF